MPETYTTFATRLRELRQKRELTQAELARRSGIPQYRLSQFETGKRMPNLATVYQLALALAVKPGKLIE